MNLGNSSNLQGLLARAVAVAIGAFISASTAFAQSWNFYTYMPAPNAAFRRVATMLDDITKATDGKLAFRTHMGGSLQISTANITAAVADNVVQLGDDSFFVGAVPIGGLIKLPLLVRSYEEFAEASKIMDPYIERAFSKRGVVFLGKYHYPAAVLWSTKKLTTVADLKGQKIRLTVPEQNEFLKLFGATGITMGTADVAPALQRGVIDGVITASAGGGVLWKDMLKYNHRFNISYSDSVLLANAEAFGKLSPDLQAKVRRVAAEGLPAVTQVMRDDEESLTKKFAADGMVVTVPKAEETAQVAARLVPVWSTWAQSRGPEAVEALAKVRQKLGR